LSVAIVASALAAWSIDAARSELPTVNAEGEGSKLARPGETVGDLMSRAKRDSSSTSSGSGRFFAFVRLMGAVVVVAFTGLALVWLWRRTKLGAPSRLGAGVVSVMGRTSISPKHSVSLLRVGSDRVIVVGICGDTLTQLATIEGVEEIEKLLSEIEAAESTISNSETEQPDRATWRDLLQVWTRRVSSVGTGSSGEKR